MSVRRLSYTRSAFARRVMMSRDSLFVVIEGIELDSPFYDGICESSATLKKAGYQIWLSQQIREDTQTDGASGKTAVVEHYEYFKSKGHLSFSTSSNGKNSMAFMLDRDNEDITGGRKRSKHVIYTDMCDVEAEAFAHGDNSKSLALALSLDSSTAEQLNKSLGDWIGNLAVIWRAWIEWCCIAKATGARCQVGFGRESTINTPKYGPLDPLILASESQIVQAKARCGSTEFTRKKDLILQKISRLHANGRAGRTVKGKWLPFYLEYLVAQYFGSTPYAHKGFTSFVARAYLGTCDFRAEWANYYRSRLEGLITADVAP
ncbi:hypothetical protein [Streptomyces sp. NPDC048663]|uniref:hypothetical protein n=1 Tax=Streptomyces sp. NPDC048663 TaxID=3155638 RepID=UPI0034238BE3